MTHLRWIVLLVFAGGLVGCGGGSPEATAKKALNGLKDGDVGAVAGLLPPDGLMQNDHPEAARISQAARWSQQLFTQYEGIDKFEIEDEDDFEVHGDIARIEADATCNKEREVTVEGETKKEDVELDIVIELMRYKGKWRVMDINWTEDR